MERLIELPIIFRIISKQVEWRKIYDDDETGIQKLQPEDSIMDDYWYIFDGEYDEQRLYIRPSDVIVVQTIEAELCRVVMRVKVVGSTSFICPLPAKKVIACLALETGD